MYAEADMPQTLPVFPLPGALLLPRARLPLHLFEPRYLAMLDDVLKTEHRLIGMIQPVPGQGADAPDGSSAGMAGDTGAQSGQGLPAEPPLHEIGCAGRITAFSETPDRRCMITLTGISRFRCIREVEGFAPYRMFDVDWAPFARDLGPEEQDPGFDRERFNRLLERYFETQEMKADWDSLRDAGDELLINSLAMLCPLEAEDRQALLEAPSLSQRRKMLETLFGYALHSGRGEKVMQ